MSEVNEQVKQWLTQPTGLATRLRAVRTQAGLTSKALGERLGWPEYRLSKLLNGTKIPSVTEVGAICAACDVGPEQTRELLAMVEEAVVKRSDFRARQKNGQAEVQKTYGQLVEQAAVIRYFEVAYVPGLLQTPDYARRVFEEQVLLHGGQPDIDNSVAERMEPQRLLYDPSKKFEFLLTEAVLRLVLPSVEAMRAQLDRLQTVIGMSNTRFGVIPFGVPLPITPQRSFQLYGDIAALEDFLGDDLHRGETPERLKRVYDLLWDEAVEGDAARRLIVAAQHSLAAIEK